MPMFLGFWVGLAALPPLDRRGQRRDLLGVVQLMNFALDFAMTNKYEVVWLGVWEHNNRAQKFYWKYGFEKSGHTHPFPIGNTPQTDLWLWKFLDGQGK